MSTPLAPELIGLEVGDDAIRLAAVSDGVAACRSAPLPEGAVADGDVADPDAVAEALRGALASWGIRARLASLAIGGRRTLCRVQPLTGEDLAAAQAACGERMRRYLTFGGQPATVGHLFQDGHDAEAAQAWLLSAAAPRDIVLRQVKAAKRGGLAVVRVEPALAAVARLLLACRDAQPAFLLVAYADGCALGVLRRDGLIYCEHLHASAAALAASDGLTASLEELADYHFRHARGREPIDTLWCCGAADGLGATFPRLAADGIHAQWLDPAAFPGIERLDGPPSGDAAARAAMAPAVAAAVDRPEGTGHHRCLDLLPPPPRKRRARLLAPWLVVPATITLLLTSVLTAWDYAVRRRAAELTRLVAHPTPEMLRCSRLQLRESQLKERSADAEALLASVPRHAGAAFLAELPRRIVKEVWLDRLEFGAAGACVVGGMAHTEDAVFAFADALRRSPYVEGVRMGGTHSERQGEMIVTRFRLDVALASAAAAPGAGGKP